MPTGDKYTAFSDKRNLPQQRLKDTFFDYLFQNILNVTSRVWAGKRGIFGTTGIASGGTDRVLIQSPPVEALDGDGNVLRLTTANGFDGPYYFENENAIDYTMGARFVAVPRGVVRNPRNNVTTYDMLEESVGVAGDPDSVSETAGQLDIVVDSVFEAGVSNANRTATVYLKNPITTDESVAIERGVPVTWDGSNNKITTTGLLGQTSGNVSTNPAAYTVVAEGVTIRRNTDLSATDPYAFVGTVTGGGSGSPPSAFSTVGQIDVTGGLADSLHSAYVNGRTINPQPSEGGEVKIESVNVGGEFRTAVLIKRSGSDGSEDASGCLYTLQDADSGVAIAHLMPIKDYTAADLQESEAGGKFGTQSIVLTRVGVDITGAGACPIHAGYDLALLEGFATENGLYQITGVTPSDVIDVEELAGGLPATWTAETGTVRILRPRMIGYGTGAWRGSSVMSGWEMHGGPNQDPPFELDTANETGVLKLFPWEAGASLVLYDGSANPHSRFNQDGNLEDEKLHLTRFRDAANYWAWDVEITPQTTPEDQILLRNSNSPDSLFGVERISATHMLAHLSPNGDGGSNRLTDGDKVTFGINHAVDPGDILGMEIERFGSGEEFSLKLGQPDSATGHAELIFGPDVTPTTDLGFVLKRGHYRVRTKTKWIWLDFSVWNLKRTTGDEFSVNSSLTNPFENSVFTQNAVVAMGGWTSDWPEGCTINSFEVDWDDGGATDVKFGVSRQIWPASSGSTRTIQSMSTLYGGTNLLTHPGGGRRFDTYSCNQNNTGFAHEVDKVYLNMQVGSPNPGTVHVYGIRMNVTFDTVSKWDAEL